MKIKLESSSYNFKTKEEEDSFKARIKDSLDIDIEKFEFNAGLRSIAKLCLNSLWGKFGQRNNMSQTKYVTDVSEFYEILLDDKLDNKNFQFINDYTWPRGGGGGGLNLNHCLSDLSVIVNLWTHPRPTRIQIKSYPYS